VSRDMILQREPLNEQPPNDAVFYQTYAHSFARIFVRPLIGTWIRPNHLTALRLVSGLAACALLAVGTRLQLHGAAFCGLLVAFSTEPMASSRGWAICAATAARYLTSIPI
jgi:hypothetical protein